MISTEEKIEIMKRERIAYIEGYKDGLRLVVAGVAVCILVMLLLI